MWGLGAVLTLVASYDGHTGGLAKPLHALQTPRGGDHKLFV